MTTAFSMPRHEPLAIKPVSNNDHQLVVEPREDGSWCLRFDTDPLDRRMGHYPNAASAEAAARLCVTNVRPPKIQTLQDAALRDIGKRLHNLTREAADSRLTRFEIQS